MAVLAQALGQNGCLGGFPGAIVAFKADEGARLLQGLDPQQGIKLLDGTGHQPGALGLKLFPGAIAIQGGDGVDAVFPGTLGIRAPVANHHSLQAPGVGPGNQLTLAGVLPGPGPSHLIKEMQQIKGLQNLKAGAQGLVGGHPQDSPLLLQSLKKRADARIDRVFKKTGAQIILPVDVLGLGGLRHGHAGKLGETDHEGRPQKLPQHLLLRQRPAHLLVGIAHPGQNPRGGIGEGAVQIKDYCLVFHHFLLEKIGHWGAAVLDEGV